MRHWNSVPAVMRKLFTIGWTVVKVAVAVAFVARCSLFLVRFDRYVRFVVPAWGKVLGMVLLPLGAATVLTCGGILSTRGILGSEDPLFPTEFVAWGPFQYVRNPMSL